MRTITEITTATSASSARPDPEGLLQLSDKLYSAQLQLIRLWAVEEADLRSTIRLTQSLLRMYGSACNFLRNNVETAERYGHWLEIKSLTFDLMKDIIKILPSIIAENSITCNMYALLASTDMCTSLLRAIEAEYAAQGLLEQATSTEPVLTEQQANDIALLSQINFEELFQNASNR